MIVLRPICWIIGHNWNMVYGATENKIDGAHCLRCDEGY